jgi:hypothetical protein
VHTGIADVSAQAAKVGKPFITTSNAFDRRSWAERGAMETKLKKVVRDPALIIQVCCCKIH